MNPPIEVERKRELPGSGKGVTARLAELGYREDGQFVEIDTYYSPQHTDYLVTIECLRVRQREGFAEITYKPASDEATHSATGVISKPETDVLLRDGDQADAANQLMTSIGMVKLVRVEKHRTIYRSPECDHLTVAVDTVAGVGTFVETEVKTSGDHDGVAQVENVERQLGITTCEVVTLPYRDLVRAATTGALSAVTEQ